MERRKIFRIIRIALLVVIAVCLLQIWRENKLSARHKQYQEDLSSMLRAGAPEREEGAEQPKSQEAKAEEQIQPQESAVKEQMPAQGMEAEGQSDTLAQERDISDRFRELYAANNDLTGWLIIPGTVIDYPVMQCEDNEYYLHHNFYREEDRYGCLFVKDIADVDTPGTNFIIYGHNMKDGAMFGELDEYRDKSFYEEHPFINFDTLYEERTYEIMAVFLSRVYKEDEDVFKYYQFYQADSEEEFLAFYENIMDRTLYETGVTAEFGDTFLMLSTCAYHEENGRLVVVAKRRNEEAAKAILTQ